MGALGSLVGGFLWELEPLLAAWLGHFSNKIIDPILNKVETDRSLKDITRISGILFIPMD